MVHFRALVSRVRAGGRRTLFAGLLTAAGAVAAFWLLGPSAGAAEVDFSRDIRPLVNSRCATCHGGVKREAGLNLLFQADALDTTESGKRAIVPGHPERSELLRRVTHADPDERMPPRGEPLTDRQVDLLRGWIAAGAPWTPHWAYVRPEAAEPPEVAGEAWPENGVDRFVLARLEAEGLAPSPRAGCAVLLRRVSLDLVGLPPTPEEADAFCADPSQAAYERAVDRLLASPRFGERWAAMWLDLARYADSKGYEKDGLRSIWRYRDWVIDAFNRDLPFDRFTIEQLAGDLMPDPGPAEAAARSGRLLATAFHRNTMTNDEGGTDDEEFRVAAVIDRLNTTWEVWQGTTIACTQCHGHPYDPFRHTDFYRLLAFFNNTADADRASEAPLHYEFDEEREAEGRRLQERLRALEAEIDALVETPPAAESLAAWTERLEAYAALPNPPPTFEGVMPPPEILRIALRADSARSAYDRGLLVDYFVEAAPAFEALRARRKALSDALRALEPTVTPVLRELPPDERRETFVFDRGNWLVRTTVVEPDVPASMPPMRPEAPRDRLGLAQWLVDPENPLTARVTVNRFWAQLFGTGIVETEEDFGTQGEPPSHPGLLDWLAVRFVDVHGWSVKDLLREIVTSATYQQTSRVTPELLERDPRNRLLARGPRFRLSAEQIRDQALAVGGLLSEKMYGPSVMPPQPPDLWNAPYSSLEWTTSEGEDRYRRALYTFWRRTVPYPSMMAFDVPSREVCVSRRIRTNSPLQALVTLNDPVYVEAAAALAGRMMDEGGDEAAARLSRGYRLALLRAPSPETLALLEELYRDALARYAVEPVVREVRLDAERPSGTAPAEAREHAALTVVASAILNLDAFLTKE